MNQKWDHITPLFKTYQWFITLNKIELFFIAYKTRIWFLFFLYVYCICLQCGRPGFNPWVGKIPWRRKWQPTPGFLPGESHGRRSLVGYSPRGRKESDTTEWLHYHSALCSIHTGFLNVFQNIRIFLALGSLCLFLCLDCFSFTFCITGSFSPLYVSSNVTS